MIVNREGRWYCVTRYHATPQGRIMAEEMWDVTDQMQEAVEASAMAWISPSERVN